MKYTNHQLDVSRVAMILVTCVTRETPVVVSVLLFPTSLMDLEKFRVVQMGRRWLTSARMPKKALSFAKKLVMVKQSTL